MTSVLRSAERSLAARLRGTRRRVGRRRGGHGKMGAPRSPGTLGGADGASAGAAAEGGHGSLLRHFREAAGLSHTKCFESRFSEVNSHTNPSTYPLLLLI